ncbi:peptidase M16 [Croceicoccus naphthovorans]|uniref:Peptidase M16 n=1 Tax=Croceicoccus naphthovorans TaxID=1348774 RepID=A0A0G3XJW7_9SPHN|nr:peptidase M16 [Croceicoccus naphthovorans]
MDPATPVAAAATHAKPSQSGLPPFEQMLAQSDLPPDPAMRFGRLPNGLSYVIRPNATPAGTAEVRLRFDVGSLDESAEEQGYAHFVEHMAFNGSTNVPEGEMIALLERKGLAFGADTNASTGFVSTTYKLSLPRNDADLLDTALMLMRETASELTFNDAAVDRERGIVLSERREGNTYGFVNFVDKIAFESPDASYPDRLPIGTLETLNAANGTNLKAFWQRNYRPEMAQLMVIGDFAPDAVEAEIRKRFASWQAPDAPVTQRSYGTVDLAREPAVDIHLNPALPENVTVTRQGAFDPAPDTLEKRKQDVLAYLGHAIINRRLVRLARQEEPPFKSASIGSEDVFRIGRITRLSVNTTEGGWERGLTAAATEYRRAMAGGFSQAEVAEQVAKFRTSLEDAAAGEATRSNRALIAVLEDFFDEGKVPTLPSTGLDRFNELSSEITPENVLAALKKVSVPLDNGMLRFSGKTEPTGGAGAIRAAWVNAMQAPMTDVSPPEAESFAYGDFGPAGTVVSDVREPIYGIRTITFANNVRLNLKTNDLSKDRVFVRVSLDGGYLLSTRDNPRAVELVPWMPRGGLGKHSADELDSILAGKSVALDFGPAGDSFVSTRVTTPRDLDLQLQLLTAFVTDPGWRPEAISAYRNSLPDRFARMEATPSAAMSTHQLAVIADGDPRFTTAPIEFYQALDFSDGREAITDRLDHGAIEIALVGDFDEDAAIADVARTFGALPEREAEFRDRTAARERSFTARRGPVFLRHDGEPDQALIRVFFPTTDDADPELTATLELLEAVTQIELNQEIREKLGQTYSPGVGSSMSRTYDDFGFFLLNIGVDMSQVPATMAEVDSTLATMRDAPVPDDILQRARQPLLEKYDNALKTNGTWLNLADRAQSQPDRVERFAQYRTRIMSITAEDLQAAARRWLPEGGSVDLIAIPRAAAEPDLP